MKVLAFAASSSSKSINKKLAAYTLSLLDNADGELLDINDYEMPLFSEDREKELGKPQLAQDFLNKIAASDALIISFAEHNGSYSAAYKNLFDWCSRINPKVYQGKQMILLATSPGTGGGSSVLAVATMSAPYFDGVVKASISMPKFYDNFDLETGKVTDSGMQQQLLSAVQELTP
ncbi:NADPH-dependent FMN reductase [Endozoicomonas sp. (ex Bugula neritina AB1)]|nr:NADPH-dependent FMN reductase [Endozoicomonas sp. (ex Bugula neritina AB1)]